MGRLFVRLSPHGVHNPASGSARGRRRRVRRGRPRARSEGVGAWAEGVGARTRRGRAGMSSQARAWAQRGGTRAAACARGRGLAETCNFSRYGCDSGGTTRKSACLGARGATGRARRAQRSVAQRSGLRTRVAPGKVWRAQRGNASATRRGPAPDATTRGAGATSRARRGGRRGGSPPGRSSRRRGSARGPCPLRDPA